MTERTPPLTLDKVDLSELATYVDHQDWGAAYLDADTGEVWPAFEGEVLGPDGDPVDADDHDSWVAVGGRSSSHEAYRDMEDFANAVADPSISGRLRVALEGRGAFRRFRDTIWHQPEEIGRAWSRYRTGCAELRALDWLLEEELVAETEVEAARVEVRRVLDSVLAEVGQQRKGTGVVVDIADKLTRITQHWAPKTVALLNDYEVKLVKLQGEFVWHTHDETDELFLVIDGRLTIRLRDDDVVLGPGQLYVVPAGVEHCPVTDGEVHAMLIEPRGVVNTGDTDTDRAAPPDDSLLD